MNLDGGRCDEPVQERLLGQPGHFGRLERNQRMTKLVFVGFRVGFIVVVDVSPAMFPLYFPTTTDVVAMSVKWRTEDVKCHKQEQQPTPDHRPSGGAVLIGSR
ncbi:hypothetical protein EV672_1202 [Aquabacterium commune]|uniref:Uncharacterized protein n=1 Tax=Aquabacterium commune TaxID=70586 RepID=A0A4R6QZE2_9BURK|nr:hypothetical protein EV672_1202 [Aquabacterium commune]